MTDLNQEINGVLADQNEKLAQQNQALIAELQRRDRQGGATLDKILSYMPQVTNLATNTSYVASANQNIHVELTRANAFLERLADAIEVIAEKVK